MTCFPPSCFAFCSHDFCFQCQLCMFIEFPVIAADLVTKSLFDTSSSSFVTHKNEHTFFIVLVTTYYLLQNLHNIR